jgi:hypothetical protein
MSHLELRNYIATFLSSFVVFLLIGSTYLIAIDWIDNRPVLTPLDQKFRVIVCDNNQITLPNGTIMGTVKPGESVQYEIHYFKRLDIPGDVSKQLIVKPKAGGPEVYIPLRDVAGHLPVGEVRKRAYVNIPAWTPEGIARVKISSTHLTRGNPQHSTVETDEFMIRN